MGVTSLPEKASNYLVLFLRALTPIHVGAGRGYSEHVDLPIQRDEFGIPCIWGSSLKGSLRASIRGLNVTSDKCYELCMGAEPESPRVSEFASAIGIMDAKLLLIPARSLRGVWTYVTSPHLIGYLSSYLEAVGKEPIKVKDTSYPIASSGDLLLKDGRVVLNEMDFGKAQVDPGIIDEITKLIPGKLLDHIKSKGLIVLDDSSIDIVIKKSLLVQYRVRLNPKTKTVDVGPWSEEYLPQETILVTLVRCVSPRTSSTECKDCCNWLTSKLESLQWSLWIGGRETIGKGLLKVYVKELSEPN